MDPIGDARPGAPPVVWDHLPPELWDVVLDALPDEDWARLRTTCRALRALADAPEALVRRLARPGLGWRPKSATAGLGVREIPAALARRAHLRRDVDHRQLAYHVLPPAVVGEEVSPLAEGMLFARCGIGSEGRILSLGQPPSVSPSVARFLPWGAQLNLIGYKGPFLLFLVAQAQVAWVHARNVHAWVGRLGDHDGEGEILSMTLSADGGRGGILLRSGKVWVGNQVRAESWRWAPAGAPSHQPVELELACDGAVAVLLDDAPALTGWRVGREVPSAPLWHVRLSEVGLWRGSWRGAMLAAPGTGHYLLLQATAADEEDAQDDAASAGQVMGDGPRVAESPTLLSLDRLGRAVGGPRPLALAAGEVLYSLRPSTTGAHLCGWVQASWGYEGRRWTLPVGEGSEAREEVLAFARSEDPFHLLSLSSDGALAAVVAGPSGAQGSVSLWRLDKESGPDRVWTFKPAYVVYRSLAFLSPSDDLVLCPAAGGAIVLWREAPPGVAVACGNNFAAPDAVWRDLHADSHYMYYGDLTEAVRNQLNGLALP